LRQEGEQKLAELVRQALDRTGGRPTPEDTAAVNDHVRRYRIERTRAEAIVEEARQRWRRGEEETIRREMLECQRLHRAGKDSDLFLEKAAPSRVGAWRAAAERGLADAQWLLAQAYESGQGVVQDHTEALRWSRKSAEQGHASGQYNRT
jgi:hypothetical protein